MHKRVLFWESVGIVIIFALGFLIHFGYEWFNNLKPLAGIFTVNESVWEHCKLTFWSPLIFAVIEYWFIRRISNNFIIAKAANAFIATLAMVMLFYTYTGIIGFNILWVDILIFLIAVIIGQYVSCKILTANLLPTWLSVLAAVFIGAAIFKFYFFTFNPIRIPLFQDPQTGMYGIPK